MRVVYSSNHRSHHPRFDPEVGVVTQHLETLQRADHILEVLRADGGFAIESATPHGGPRSKRCTTADWWILLLQ